MILDVVDEDVEVMVVEELVIVPLQQLNVDMIVVKNLSYQLNEMFEVGVVENYYLRIHYYFLLLVDRLLLLQTFVMMDVVVVVVGDDVDDDVQINLMNLVLLMMVEFPASPKIFTR